MPLYAFVRANLPELATTTMARPARLSPTIASKVMAQAAG
jgi:hypothetical protein